MSQTLEKEITAQDWRKVDSGPQQQNGSLTLRAQKHQLNADNGVECFIGDN